MGASIASECGLQTVHALLLQAPVTAADMAMDAAHQAVALLDGSGLPAGLQVLRVAYQPDVGCYVYLDWSMPVILSASQRQSAEAVLRQAWSGHAQLGACHLSRLQRVMHRDGPSTGLCAPTHYVVEMDPEAGWEEELFRWYDEEHMPGLASVSGTVSADRYLNLDHGPRSLACYDLMGPEVMGCPDWLAVRATSWSSQVRPHFTNTKRTMFERMRARV
jgi:hypothetical protein